ncbi:MAG: hypothetical protein HOO96_06370 [Polyangiaceae bacterium]|nr:hypothetical protein [Polyangiaceae bacterium]
MSSHLHPAEGNARPTESADTNTAAIAASPILIVGEKSHIDDDEELIEEPEDPEPPRMARIGNERVELYGSPPSPGDRVTAHFEVAPARNSSTPLTPAHLRSGLVLMTTLPNIHKHACTAQIIGLEALARDELPHARLLHVSSDAVEHWAEVDELHGSVTAEGYSLDGAVGGDSFRDQFGVGVRGSRRIARGLFALLDGVVLAADVPENQGRTPSIRRFIERTCALTRLLGPWPTTRKEEPR